jgi:hypothetical protein
MRVRIMAYVEGVGVRACWTYEYGPPVSSAREIRTGQF